MKFNRSFKILVENINKEVVEITSPLTIQFDITRTTSSSVNQMNLMIYNLSETVRNSLYQDKFLLRDEANKLYYRQIILQAGYGQLSTIFKGDIWQAYSVRQGADIITILNCHDGGYAASNSYSAITFDAKTAYQDIFETAIGDLVGIEKGGVGAIEGTPKRGVVFNGNTFSLIKEFFNNRVYIDLEKINILAPSEAIQGDVLLINSESGLIGTPIRQNTYLTVDIIFEPRIIVGQLVEIQSEINPYYNGQFKVDGIKHAGIISEAIAGECKTTLQLYIGSDIFDSIKVIEER